MSREGTKLSSSIIDQFDTLVNSYTVSFRCYLSEELSREGYNSEDDSNIAYSTNDTLSTGTNVRILSTNRKLSISRAIDHTRSLSFSLSLNLFFLFAMFSLSLSLHMNKTMDVKTVRASYSYQMTWAILTDSAKASFLVFL